LTQIIGTGATRLKATFFSKLCNTTGFLVFLIKDCLEYSGIIIEKKTNHTRIYNNMTYLYGKLSQKMDKLKELLKKSN